MQQRNCVVDLEDLDVLEAAKDTVEVSAADHLTPETLSRNMVRLFCSNISRPATHEIIMTEDNVAEVPVNYLLLEISIYGKLSGKTKKYKIHRSTSILVYQATAVLKLLARLNTC